MAVFEVMVKAAVEQRERTLSLLLTPMVKLTDRRVQGPAIGLTMPEREPDAVRREVRSIMRSGPGRHARLALAEATGLSERRLAEADWDVLLGKDYWARLAQLDEQETYVRGMTQYGFDWG